MTTVAAAPSSLLTPACRCCHTPSHEKMTERTRSPIQAAKMSFLRRVAGLSLKVRRWVSSVGLSLRDRVPCVVGERGMISDGHAWYFQKVTLRLAQRFTFFSPTNVHLFKRGGGGVAGFSAITNARRQMTGQCAIFGNSFTKDEIEIYFYF